MVLGGSFGRPLSPVLNMDNNLGWNLDLHEFISDTKNNATIMSPIPEMARRKPCLLGIDEAGRGPVLGPMVYGIAYCPLEKQECLKELGFVDSKTLTDERRRDMLRAASGHSDWFGWMLRVISPNFICNSMLNVSKYSLNAVSQDAASDLIRRALHEGVDVREVYVDTVGPPDKYRSKLEAEFPDLYITVEKKADSTYPIVSAASVCAKVARDGALESWRFEKGLEVRPEDYGSGYPNDPTTQKFLAEHVDPVFGFPDLVRFSWATADKILQERAAAIEWPEEEDAEEMPSILGFFKRAADGGPREPPPKRSAAFFSDRTLLQAVHL